MQSYAIIISPNGSAGGRFCEWKATGNHLLSCHSDDTALLVYMGYCTQYISLCMEKVLEEDEGLKTIMEQVINFTITGE